MDLVGQNSKINLLLTPANTPEFSPIENLFGFVKRKLADFEFDRGEKGKKKHPRLAFLQILELMKTF